MNLDTLEIKSQKIILDFNKNNYVSITAKQYDVNSRYVVIQLTNNGEAVILGSNENYVAEIKMLTPDNKEILDQECLSIQEDGTLLLEITDMMLCTSGKATAEIRLYELNDGSSKLLSAMNFYIVVIASPYDEDKIINSQEYKSLIDLYEKVTKDYTYIMTESETYANLAKQSEMNAAMSATAAENSATVASDKAAIAYDKADEALISANNSEQSAKNALASEQNAKASENTAIAQATIATDKAAEALISEQNAKDSENVAIIKANEAEQSAINALNSETIASTKADEAKASEINAESHMNVAIEKANEAKQSETIASTKADEALISANNAFTSAINAANSAQEVLDMANMAQSYAVGTNGEIREGDSTDNALYYYELSRRIAQGVNGLIYMGTVTYEDLSNPDYQQTNYMFNISEPFTTDDTFKEGAGHSYGAGVNVCRTADGYWDALVGSTVTGIKGNAETSFRTGNVNITAKDIGIPNPEVVSESEPTNQETGAFWMLSY